MPPPTLPPKKEVPPPPVTWLPLKVQETTVAVPSLSRPPPKTSMLLLLAVAVLFFRASRLRVSVEPTSLRMPPPPNMAFSSAVTLPLAMVRPAMVTFALLLMSKIRLALLPLTVIWLAPGPLMVMLLVRFSWPLRSVMVPCRPGAKSMTAPVVASAAWTAARNEPGPLSWRLDTTRGGALSSVRSSSASRRGRKRGSRRPAAGRRFLGACRDCRVTACNQRRIDKRDMVQLLRYGGRGTSGENAPH